MLTGLSKNGIQNHIGLRILLTSFWRILRYITTTVVITSTVNFLRFLLPEESTRYVACMRRLSVKSLNIWFILNYILMWTPLYLQSIDESVHVTSDEKVCWVRVSHDLLICREYVKRLNNFRLFFLQREVQRWPCLWNGMQKPCYLFARKFTPETEDSLLKLFSNYSSAWAARKFFYRFFGRIERWFRPSLVLIQEL
jgi:hypothetical protein